jgi:HK97 family phage major capsid protein
MSKLAKLQTKRNDAAAKIRKMADTFKANGKKWQNASELAEWDKANAAYDAIVADVDKLLGDASVLERASAVEKLQEAPVGNPHNIGLDDAGGNRRRRTAPAAMFRNLATGAMIPALRASEPLAQSRRQGMDLDADPDDDATGNLADVGELIFNKLTGRAGALSMPAMNAMIGGTDSGGGYILNPATTGAVLDLARSASVAMRAGALTVPMEAREMTVARITQDPTAYWRAEGQGITGTTMAFDRVTLRAKTLAAIVPVTIELIEDAANAGPIITQALQSSMGLELDKAILTGAGAANVPLGIRNHPSVNTVTGVSTPDDYSDVSNAVYKVMNANYPGEPSALAWVRHPREAKTYDALKEVGGQPLQPTPWAAAIQKLQTTSLPTTEGGGGNESIGIIGDFAQCVVGMRTSGLTIRILEAGSVTDSDGITHQAASEMKRLIVAYLRADVVLLRPTWFTLLSGITSA